MIAAILQARMSSNRLPGKVLEPVLGEPMLYRQLERLARAALVDTILVATSDRLEDDAIARVAERSAVACFRGSLADVLDRYRQAAASCAADHVVRITGDCPLTDPEVVDLVIHRHLEEENDYTANIVELTFPDGLDVEVMTAGALETCWRQAGEPRDREHVTVYLRENPGKFQLGSVVCRRQLADQRWTVDYAEDLELVVQIFSRLYPRNPAFSMWDVLALLEGQPDLKSINAARNESRS